MATHVVPILIWENSGCFVGTPVESHLTELDLTAVDNNPRGVLQQIKSALDWWYKRHTDWPLPDFREPQLAFINTRIRPQWDVRQTGRRSPYQEAVPMRLPGVRGSQGDGATLFSVPPLSVMVSVYKDDDLDAIVQENVRAATNHMSPDDIGRLIGWHGCRLDTVRVNVARRRPKRSLWTPYLPELERIAQPVGGRDFARRTTAAWQREHELSSLCDSLSSKSTNLLLVGEHGVGKSTLLFNAVRSVERQRGNDDQRQHRFWFTTAGRIISGMSYLGEWEERCESVIEELQSIRGSLCVDRLLDLILQGGRHPRNSIAAFMRPFLRAGELRLIAEATPSQLDACRRLLPDFADLFQVVRVEPMSIEAASRALSELADERTRHLKIDMDESAVNRVCSLHARFQPYIPLPGQAAGFIRQLFEDAQRDAVESISANEVVERFSNVTGIAPRLLRDDELVLAADVEAALGRQVIGQAEATRLMADLIATFKAGLNDPGRPLGAFLFSGPTGVGKTQLAKSLAQYLFGSGGDGNARLVRIDMSEYASPFAANRFVTNDDGSPGVLIKRVREQPFVVILLDEIEKAHPDAFDVLMGVLDEGRLTDRLGRTANFCSSIVIMTSNLGAGTRSRVGFGEQLVAENDPRTFFRPEFYNRIDAVVRFHPLSHETCLRITENELQQIAEREGLRQAGVGLEFSPALISFLAERGFDERFGARPLQRTIDSLVVSALSRYLVELQANRTKSLPEKLCIGQSGGIVTIAE